jgi:predicted MPP superfamily phosphohydrolase
MNARSRYILLALLIGAAAILVCHASSSSGQTPPPAADVRFYFVQITDTHLGADRNWERTVAAVEAVNALPKPIEFVAHTGDIFDRFVHNASLVEAGMGLFKRLHAPVHFVPGNHDIPRGGEDLTAEVKFFRQRVGPLSHTLECHGVLMIFFYVEPLAGNFQVAGYDPLAWLESTLKAAQGRPAIIFIHSPPVRDFFGGRSHAGWPHEYVMRWNDLLSRYNVKAVIAGHFHRNETHHIAGVPLFISAAIADTIGLPGSFRLYKYDNGRVTYTTHYLNGPRRPAAPAPASASAPAVIRASASGTATQP